VSRRTYSPENPNHIKCTQAQNLEPPIDNSCIVVLKLNPRAATVQPLGSSRMCTNLYDSSIPLVMPAGTSILAASRMQLLEAVL
jgi:hypothetical protein